MYKPCKTCPGLEREERLHNGQCGYCRGKNTTRLKILSDKVYTIGKMADGWTLIGASGKMEDPNGIYLIRKTNSQGDIVTQGSLEEIELFVEKCWDLKTFM